MLPFRKVLFPVDYSEPCLAIVPSVVELLQHFSAELTVVHAYGAEALAYSPLPISDPTLPAQVEELAQERLQDFVKTHFPGRRVELFTGIGEPGGVIHDIVTREGADLVMLPTHGRGPFRRLLLGSVTAKVLHDMTVPVWTASHLPEALRVGCKSVLAAVHGGEEAEVVMRAAAAFAESYQARLSLAYVMEMAPVSAETAFGPDRADYIAAAEAQLAELKGKTGIDAPHAVLDGPVAGAIAEQAQRDSADLIVTGRGQALGAFSRLWSDLYPIVRHAPCPVLSI